MYSLGAVLYEMATGQPPFGGSRTDIFVQVLSASPTPPSRVRAGIDSGLDAITLKALAKRPWDRFTGMAEFADALDQWLAGVRDQAPRGGGWPSASGSGSPRWRCWSASWWS